MGILSINLNCINLDDNNFDEDDSDTIVMLNLQNAKHLKKT